MADVFTPEAQSTRKISATSTSQYWEVNSTPPQAQFINAGPDMAYASWGNGNPQVADPLVDVPIPVGAIMNYTKGNAGKIALVCNTGQTAVVYVTPGSGP